MDYKYWCGTQPHAAVYRLCRPHGGFTWLALGSLLALSWCILGTVPVKAELSDDYFVKQVRADIVHPAKAVSAVPEPGRNPVPRPPLPLSGAGTDIGTGTGASLAASVAASIRAQAGAGAAVGPDSHGVFGSVAIAFKALPAAKRWRTILAEDGDRYFGKGCNGDSICRSATMKELKQLRREAAGLAPEAVLAMVNRRVNRALAYTSDEAAYGRLDHWAGLGETIRRGAADCEDFAITKMWVLKSLGFRLDDMQFVVLRDVKRSRYHAVLAAHVDGKALVLDNATDAVYADKAARHYKPIYSLSRSGSWIHGFRSGQPAMAAADGRVGAIHPGSR